MEAEVRTLREDLAGAREKLKTATRNCRRLVHELEERATNRDAERQFQDQQLSKILRALLILESKLKQEQKSIRQLLCEKDNVIRAQQLEIARLRRYTKSYIKAKRDLDFESFESPVAEINHAPTDESHDDIQQLKCEIITRLRDDRRIQKTSSFSGSDISKSSSTSTTTSLLSTEGFCEGFLTDSSECEAKAKSPKESEKKTTTNNSEDDGMDCNYNSEAEAEAEAEAEDKEESSGNWYSDPDEDRANDESFTIYQSNSNRNSVLECVNQILLRDMEEEENSLSLSRRYKHKGKVVCFQAAKLSDIESVGSEIERKNSEENGAGITASFEDEFGERKMQEAKALVIIEPSEKRGQTTIPSPEPSSPKFVNTLILKEIPSPSFLINESRKKASQKSPSLSGTSPKSFKVENSKKSRIHLDPNIVAHFEEFKIEDEKKDIDAFDMTQNFEEFKFDEFPDDPDRAEADGSDVAEIRACCYDNFLEASGMSNKSILTPSRLISNHKSVMKPKDVKYKNRIKSVLEKNAVPCLRTKHWTGPFV